MPKSKRHRWRTLFALFAGIATWWLLGWWLSPRPILDLTLRLDDLTPADRQSPKPSELPTPYFSGSVDITVLDRHGRYLMIHSLMEKSKAVVYDMQTRRPIVHVEDKSLYRVTFPDFGNIKPLRMQDDGSLYFNNFSNPEYPELWRWQVLTNDWKQIRSYSSRESIEVSRDGSTLLEQERWRVMYPQFLLPMNWSSLFGAMAEARVGSQDVIEDRVLSLPSLTSRLTITRPFRPGVYALLSGDGTYLILSDHALHDGWSSSRSMPVHHGSIPMPEHSSLEIINTNHG